MNPAIDTPAFQLDSALRRLRQTRVTETSGRVAQIIGLVIESEGPIASVGEVCRIDSARHDGSTLAEVVGFRNEHLLLMPLGELRGIHPGSEVIATGMPMRAPVGPALKGRVLDGLGQPLDTLGPVVAEQSVGLNLLPPHPLKRQRIPQVFRDRHQGHRHLQPLRARPAPRHFLRQRRGQIHPAGHDGSQAEADVNVIALIGERGREVREFLERDLDEAGRRKSVVIVATSNEPALHRVKAPSSPWPSPNTSATPARVCC